MPKWTKEQEEAINKEGSNIIVSAGAGSGKTAVLTARVIRKLESGIDINKLLILTFTNAAAAEMRERIRSSIKKNPKLIKQLDLIDGAYITTFDSFSLSLVKKYHYLLGINKNINIADSSVIYYKKNEIINSIFDDLYNNSDNNFLKLIYDFCIKSDKDIKKYILDINNKLDLLYDKSNYLKNYIDKFYSEININKNIELFVKMLNDKISNIKVLVDNLSYQVDSDYISKIYECLYGILNANSYEEIKNNLEIKLPILPKNSSEESKKIKEQISSIIKELKSIAIYEDINDIKNGILSTKDYASSIIGIINKLDLELNKFKLENNIYEFNDISKMAINVLDKNKDICLELKESLNEIMVDEYQDTSDLQERFISLIENNNVYMVGDIKQSIYRFRNANPYIFKNKYDNYSKNKGGYKIDLNKNFRSRKETLDNINIIFNMVMDDLIGGANYKESHQMVFGNTLYLENDIESQSNNLEIYNYEFDKDHKYTKDEIECFIVAKDIKDKITNKYQVFDKEKSKLRDIKYSDFVILMDRATKFDIYKKIFEYLNIPLTKYTDTSITDSNDVLLIKNIIGLIIKYYKNEFDIEFKYNLTSIARSYLFKLSDNEIFQLLEENLLNNKIIDIIKEISIQYESLNIKKLIDIIIDKFDFYNNLIKVGNIEASFIRLEYIYNLANNIETINYSIEDFYNYLVKIVEDDFSIKVSISENSSDSVKIMTIHKSKGLEYPICYYTGIYATFNTADIKERFVFDNKYGIIIPYFKEGITKTIYSYLFKEDYLKEEISEKVRLFYVALTRCREKMIVVAPLENKTMISMDEKLKYKSFLDILNSVYNYIESYITNISTNDIGLDKNYNLIKDIDYKNLIDISDEKLIIINNEISNEEINSRKYSKTSKELINNKIRKNMELGNKLHQIFEFLDFKDPNIDNVPEKYRHFVEKFLSIGIDFSNCTIYKELEFVYNEDCNNTHGVIDLMLEYENEIKIIDYKLSNIMDEEYKVQLNGYKKYIKTKTKKEVNIYLYSIINGELKEL